jgi:hypothetical protein
VTQNILQRIQTEVGPDQVVSARLLPIAEDAEVKVEKPAAAEVETATK